MNNAKSISRADENGYTTKVTFLGTGWGLRVLRKGVIISQSFVDRKGLIYPALQDMLRWIDKGGGGSSMASASRDRLALKLDKKEAWQEKVLKGD